MAHVPYASVVGILIYSMVYTQLYISHSVRVLKRYMLKLGKEHWIDVKRVFMYFHGTTKYEMFYLGKPKIDREVNVHGFFDAN
jgi:hypothetical protein